MQRCFHTVLRHLKSPENVGLIVRQHAAFSGGKLIFIGEQPWRFSKSSRAFSRRMEELCEVVHFTADAEFFRWSKAASVSVAAIEIDSRAEDLPTFSFPPEVALVVGHERDGLPREFLDQCDSILKIPQHGPVACLNVAAAAIIAMYELRRSQKTLLPVSGAKYLVPGASGSFD